MSPVAIVWPCPLMKYYVGSVTLGVPLGLPKELGLSGRVFTDFGTLYQIEWGFVGFM